MTVKQKIASLREKAVRAALIPSVYLMSAPAWADIGKLKLPDAPADKAVAGVKTGNWLGDMGAWFHTGIVVLGTILVSLGFVYVVGGAFGKWRQYARGQADIADLKEYFIMGTILTLFLVAMITYGFSALAS